MEQGVVTQSLDDFYYLARLVLVKDEAHYDRFDRAFAQYFKGIDGAFDGKAAIPLDWLLQRMKRELTDEQKATLEKFGYDKLMDRLAELLKEQKERHEGGGKWIGTGGTSPFGNGGTNPEGIRIGGAGGNRTAVKVWEQRAYKDYDAERELGTRNIKVALRRLRKFARTGAPDELDLDGTIKGTAHKGYLDIHMRPERHNSIKVLALFDIGGSMDWHIKLVEELFSAARAEFKHLAHFYFHNCLYEKVWKENRRRFQETTPTWDVLHKYPHDYKVVIVGDASMSPYEITAPGGSVEHFNEEAGAVWLERVTRTYPACVWLNPVPEEQWDYTYSIRMIRQMMGNRMYPLTLAGLDKAMRELVR
jgi:uncharacterized protein with von Willebrand factor type A (vWA) domain